MAPWGPVSLSSSSRMKRPSSPGSHDPTPPHPVNPRLAVVSALGALTLVALLLVVLGLAALAIPAGRRTLDEGLLPFKRQVLLGAWVVALVAMVGSLYLSDGIGLQPCELCWYQRIAMYPLVVVLGVGFLRRDGHVWKTGVPLAAIGALISAYHVTIQYQPALEVTTCSGETPCSMRFFQLYGFVSIPVMAGSAFLLVILLLALHARLDEAIPDAPPPVP